jgi:hypothetical protein
MLPGQDGRTYNAIRSIGAEQPDVVLLGDEGQKQRVGTSRPTRTLSESEMPAESASLSDCASGRGLGARAAGRERARHDGRGVVERRGVVAARVFARSGRSVVAISPTVSYRKYRLRRVRSGLA